MLFFVGGYMKIRNPFSQLTKSEWILWGISAAVVTVSFFFGENNSILNLVASPTGVTSLIFVAKGDVFGQMLTVLFSIMYSIISYRFRYYGEMITYLGMTAPVALMSVISWLRHPFESGKAEVKIEKLTKAKIIALIVLNALITTLFYFILMFFNTPNLIISTISVTTSFAAAFLQFLRSPIYAVAYAANDIVLIILWTLASFENPSFISVVACFTAFFANDIYGFINWRRMKKRQNKITEINRQSS